MADARDRQEGRHTACAAAALDYAARGWSVVPVALGEKRPLVPWESWQESVADAATIRSWYRRWPEAGVGIVTGVVSGLVVLDIDRTHGGAQSLDALQREFGVLPATLEVASGGGGRHLYFQHPGGTVRNRAGLRPGLDLRGDGGFIVAPPSMHASGHRYLWRPGHAPEDTAPAPLPRWLSDPKPGRAGRSPAAWRELVRAGVPEGQRNSTLASLTGHLLWHGVDPEVALELLLAWNRLRCRPPLDDAEVAQVVANISRLHARDDGGAN